MDEFWHILLENEELSAAVSKALGCRIGHSENKEGDSHRIGSAHTQTHESYRRTFGRLPVTWWSSGVDGNQSVLELAPAFILKLTNVCNLDCSYCYMFHSPGASKQLPARMPPATAMQAVSRIVEFAMRHDIAQPRLILHGGEPLLVGHTYVRELLSNFDGQCRRNGLEPRASVQTNGLLLDREWRRLLSEHDVSIGLSIDGPAPVNDEYRLDHRGAGSHDRVIAAVRESGLEMRELGSITVVNPRGDGAEVFRYLESLGFLRMSFLLTDATHDSGPVDSSRVLRYLTSAFDAYWASDNPAQSVAPFDEIVVMLLGGDPRSDSLGLGPIPHMVVDTDGAIGPLDTLRVCGSFHQVSKNVRDHAFDWLLEDALYSECLWKDFTLHSQCRECRIGRICGGGYLPHRFQRASGFSNPSVYCSVLMGLIDHIKARVSSALPEVPWTEVGVTGEVEARGVARG